MQLAPPLSPVPRRDDLHHTIDPAKDLKAQIEDRAKGLPDTTLQSWMAESCLGSYPLQVVAVAGQASLQSPLGNALVLTLSLTLDAVPWLGAAPVVQQGTVST
jgi:hypothetical protein